MALTNRTLIIFKYLWETTDETHPASLADISAFLKRYEITADPRTLRKDIEQLTEFGVDIVKDRRVQNLYHVASRHFEAPEVKLLIDTVQSARFITHRKSRALVNRLSSFVAPGDTSLLKRQLYIDSRSKATNESIYLNVDRIQTAITERKKISFCYFDTLLPKSVFFGIEDKSTQSPRSLCSGTTIHTISSASTITGSRSQSSVLTASCRWRSWMKPL